MTPAKQHAYVSSIVNDVNQRVAELTCRLPDATLLEWHVQLDDGKLPEGFDDVVVRRLAGATLIREVSRRIEVEALER